MPGVQILFHSSGERVGGPNLPQRGFFVPAVRGAAVRCGDFSAGKGRSGRFRGRGRLRAGKRLNRRGVPVCGGESSRRAGKRMEDGDGSGGGEQKKSGGRMSLSGFFYDKESADKPGRPGRSAAVLPPSGPPNCGPRRLGSWSSCRLRLRCLSARPFWPPAICSGAR